MKIEVTSEWAQTVDGLAVFAKGETKSFTKEQIEKFFAYRGIPVGFEHNLPGLTFEVAVGGVE